MCVLCCEYGQPKKGSIRGEIYIPWFDKSFLVSPFKKAPMELFFKKKPRNQLQERKPVSGKESDSERPKVEEQEHIVSAYPKTDEESGKQVVHSGLPSWE